jgi:hypothetical protein
MAEPSQATRTKRIDFEAHFVTAAYVRAMEENPVPPRYQRDLRTGRRRLCYAEGVTEPLGDNLLSRLLDVGEQRLAQMDAAGIDLQVLSLTAPGVEQLDPARGTVLAAKINEELARVIDRHPGRFLGMAALAPGSPHAAADELERAVTAMGFVGWKTHANFGQTYLDDEQYWPILERAAELDVPIFLHPTVPANPALLKYGFALAGAPFGFGVEASVCMMRLIYSGVLDRYPGLRVILGHLGEGLPFLLQRIDFAYVRPWFDPDARPVLKKKPGDYLRDNTFVTTSGNYLPAAFMCTRESMGIERILLGTDYPYEEPSECVRFLDGLALGQEDRHKVDCLNAAQVRVSVPPTEPAATRSAPGPAPTPASR